MDIKTLLTRTSQRGNTSTQWASLNPILYSGEIGIEIDTRKVKHGDGESHWNDLPYWRNGGETYTAGAGVIIDSYTISAELLYEILRMPNVRIRCHNPDEYIITWSIGTSDDMDVYTDE